MQFGKLSSPRAAFTKDVGLRYQAHGWRVRHVDDGEDLAAVDRALAAAQAETGRPSLIVLRPISGWPSPNKQNTGGAHGFLRFDAALSGAGLALRMTARLGTGLGGSGRG